MEIAAGGAGPQRAAALKPDFREQPRKGDEVVFAVEPAQLRAAVQPREVPVDAPAEVEVEFLPVAADPLGFPALLGEVLPHERFAGEAVEGVGEGEPGEAPHLLPLDARRPARLLPGQVQRLLPRDPPLEQRQVVGHGREELFLEVFPDGGAPAVVGALQKVPVPLLRPAEYLRALRPPEPLEAVLLQKGEGGIFNPHASRPPRSSGRPPARGPAGRPPS